MKGFMGFVFAIVAAISLYGAPANAGTTYVYGTDWDDTIVIGEWLWGNCMACVNGSWSIYSAWTCEEGNTIEVHGYGASDSISVVPMPVNYNCGGTSITIYPLGYFEAFGCPEIKLYGDMGPDTILGSNYCVDKIYGGDGDDLIIGGGQNDYVNAGDDDDCIEDTSLAFLYCGSGYDSYTDDRGWTSCENWVEYCE